MNKHLITFLLTILFAFPFSSVTYAQEINCLDCHENLISKTVHDKVIKCSDCHNDI